MNKLFTAKIKKVLFFILLALIICKLGFYIIMHQNRYSKPFDPVYFSKLYSESQYVKGTLSKGGIGDDGLYAYAGYYYVFQNGDVSNVNFEHPPIGKYLIGVSILLFNNENAINIIYVILILLCTFSLGKIVLKNNLLALLGVAIVSTNSFYLDHLLRSLLDLPFTIFFLCSIIFFIQSFDKKNYIYVSLLFLGLLISTKFFPAFIFIYPFFLGLLFIYKRSNIKAFLLGSCIIGIVYVVAHASYFLYHPSLVEFLRHKKWMIAWWTGSPISVGNILRNSFSGYYVDSTGKIAKESLWSPSIPIILTLGLTSIRKSWTKKNNVHMITIYGVSLIYFLYLVFLGGGILKFIMPIFPLLCILAIYNCRVILENFIGKK